MADQDTNWTWNFSGPYTESRAHSREILPKTVAWELVGFDGNFVGGLRTHPGFTKNINNTGTLESGIWDQGFGASTQNIGSGEGHLGVFRPRKLSARSSNRSKADGGGSFAGNIKNVFPFSVLKVSTQDNEILTKAGAASSALFGHLWVTFIPYDAASVSRGRLKFWISITNTKSDVSSGYFNHAWEIDFNGVNTAPDYGVCLPNDTTDVNFDFLNDISVESCGKFLYLFVKGYTPHRMTIELMFSVGDVDASGSSTYISLYPKITAEKLGPGLAPYVKVMSTNLLTNVGVNNGTNSSWSNTNYDFYNTNNVPTGDTVGYTTAAARESAITSNWRLNDMCVWRRGSELKVTATPTLTDVTTKDIKMTSVEPGSGPSGSYKKITVSTVVPHKLVVNDVVSIFPVSNGFVNTATIGNAGTGYAYAPTVTLSNGGGSGGSGCKLETTILNNSLSSVSVVATGNNYTGVPTCTINNTGSGGTITSCSLSGVPLEQFTLNPGVGVMYPSTAKIASTGVTTGVTTPTVAPIFSIRTKQKNFTILADGSLGTVVGTRPASTYTSTMTTSFPHSLIPGELVYVAQYGSSTTIGNIGMFIVSSTPASNTFTIQHPSGFNSPIIAQWVTFSGVYGYGTGSDYINPNDSSPDFAVTSYGSNYFPQTTKTFTVPNTWPTNNGTWGNGTTGGGSAFTPATVSASLDPLNFSVMGGEILGITVGAPGSGYSFAAPPLIKITPAAAQTAASATTPPTELLPSQTADIRIGVNSAGQLTTSAADGFSILNPGKGYTRVPTFTVSTGAGATINTTVVNTSSAAATNAVVSAVIDTKTFVVQVAVGSPITSALTYVDKETYGYIQVGVAGTVATTTNTALNKKLLALKSKGTNYQTAPSVVFTASPAGGANTATGTCVLYTGTQVPGLVTPEVGGVYYVEMTNVGAGYTEPPIATFSGGHTTSYPAGSVALKAGSYGFALQLMDTITGKKSQLSKVETLIIPVVTGESAEEYVSLKFKYSLTSSNGTPIQYNRALIYRTVNQGLNTSGARGASFGTLHLEKVSPLISEGLFEYTISTPDNELVYQDVYIDKGIMDVAAPAGGTAAFLGSTLFVGNTITPTTEQTIGDTTPISPPPSSGDLRWSSTGEMQPESFKASNRWVSNTPGNEIIAFKSLGNYLMGFSADRVYRIGRNGQFIKVEEMHFGYGLSGPSALEAVGGMVYFVSGGGLKAISASGQIDDVTGVDFVINQMWKNKKNLIQIAYDASGQCLTIYLPPTTPSEVNGHAICMWFGTNKITELVDLPFSFIKSGPYLNETTGKSERKCFYYGQILNPLYIDLSTGGPLGVLPTGYDPNEGNTFQIYLVDHNAISTTPHGLLGGDAQIMESTTLMGHLATGRPPFYTGLNQELYNCAIYGVTTGNRYTYSDLKTLYNTNSGGLQYWNVDTKFSFGPIVMRWVGGSVGFLPDPKFPEIKDFFKMKQITSVYASLTTILKPSLTTYPASWRINIFNTPDISTSLGASLLQGKGLFQHQISNTVTNSGGQTAVVSQSTPHFMPLTRQGTVEPFNNNFSSAAGEGLTTVPMGKHGAMGAVLSVGFTCDIVGVDLILTAISAQGKVLDSTRRYV